jgi:hypothetical protein
VCKFKEGVSFTKRLPALGTTRISTICCHTTLTKCFTDYFNILRTSARNYICSLIMIDRSKHVGAFKCFNVCFRIIQYILVHLLVLIFSES